MISPLTNERKYGDVSTEDFTTLGVAVVQNSSDITTANTQIATNAAKPSSSQVDSQIDAKNTTQMTQLYTRAEVDTAVTGRTTPADVQTALNTRFQAQDASNFIVFQDRATSINSSNGYTQAQVDASVAVVASTVATNTAAITAAAASTYTKTQVDAIEASINSSAASTYATQTALATVTASSATNATNLTATQVEVVLLQGAVTQDSSTLASVVAGTQALSGVDVQGNLATTGNAIVGSNLQCVDLTATGRVLSSSWGAFGSIPVNPSSGDLSCLSLSSANVNVSGALTVNGQAITGSGVAPSAGDVLKSSRTCMSPHSTITVPSNGSSIVVSSVAYVPESASSTIHVTFVGTRLMAGASGSTGQWITTIMTGGTHLGHSMHGYNNTQQIVDSSPTYASYTNSSTNSVAFSATIKQTQNGGASMLFFQSSGNKTAWFHIEEVAR